MLDIKVPDSPDLMLDVVHRFSYYHKKALEAEIVFLTEQYRRVVEGIIYRLPPGKRSAVYDKAGEIIRQIANGDKPFLTQQEFGKILKYCI